MSLRLFTWINVIYRKVTFPKTDTETSTLGQECCLLLRYDIIHEGYISHIFYIFKPISNLQQFKPKQSRFGKYWKSLFGIKVPIMPHPFLEDGVISAVGHPPTK